MIFDGFVIGVSAAAVFSHFYGPCPGWIAGLFAVYGLCRAVINVTLFKNAFDKVRK